MIDFLQYSIFLKGPNPNPLKSTRGVVLITSSKVEDQDDKMWYGNLLAKGEDTITLEVSTFKVQAEATHIVIMPFINVVFVVFLNFHS